MRQRGVQIGASFKVPSYLVHPLVVASIRFNAYDAPSLCSITGGMLPRFTQSLGVAPLLCSVAGKTLPRFTQLLGGCSLASLSHWGMLPRFAQSLGGCSLASLSHWGMLPRFAQSLGGRSLALLSRFPFNGSIKLLQNLHSRGSMKQHFYVWEPRCEFLHEVKNGLVPSC